MLQTRRRFIENLSLSCGSILFMQACSGFESPWRFFTSEEASLVIAIAEQFVPSDKDPGATEANVINFIDKQLVSHYARFQNDYRKGISSIRKSVLHHFNKKFEDLEWDGQTSFLETMEAGKLAKGYWIDIDQQSFFRMLLDHTMQGFYGSPRHGGNRYYVSYKMIGLDYPHIIGQNRYRPRCSTLNVLIDEK